MNGQVTRETVIKDMEYLVELLHKEWERSGKTKVEAVISLDEVGKVNQKLVEQINLRQRVLGNENLDFQQSMVISRENFVLLRMVRKMKKAEEKVNKARMDAEFSVEFDKEEFGMFQSILEK